MDSSDRDLSDAQQDAQQEDQQGAPEQAGRNGLDHATADPSPPDPSIAALVEAVGRLSKGSVLVVGDVMLDRFVYGDVERVSREAPVPVLAVQRELAVPGGAGNLVRNLGALGTAVAFVSVVGDDQAGSDLTGLIGGQPGVEPWLLVQGGRVTTLKTRFVANGQQLLRADNETTGPLNAKLAERMVRIASDSMAATSVTVLADHCKGVLAGDAPARLIASAKQTGRRIIVATSDSDFGRYAGADVMLPGRQQLAQATGMALDGDAGALAAAAALRVRHGFGAVLIRRGQGGMTLVDEAGGTHYRSEAAEVFDVAGAGDTTAATLAAGLAGGLDLRIAARLASIAAGIVLGRIGTAVARQADLLGALSHDGVLRKIVSRELAEERVERWRRRGWRTGFANGCFDPLRPAHLYLLEQARAACDRLVVGVSGDARVRRCKGEGRPIQPEDVRAAKLAALSFVDLVVVHDDDSPAELLQALRPEILAGGADAAPGARSAPMQGAELVQTWGGVVVQAPRLPEPALPAAD